MSSEASGADVVRAKACGSKRKFFGVDHGCWRPEGHAGNHACGDFDCGGQWDDEAHDSSMPGYGPLSAAPQPEATEGGEREALIAMVIATPGIQTTRKDAARVADVILAPRPVPVQEDGPQRLDPAFRAELQNWAANRIQSVWDDAGPTTATVLAENVVSAQEFLWMSLHAPIASPPVQVESERRAPVQGGSVEFKAAAGTVSWAEHEEAWLGYKRRFRSSAAAQDATRIAERGGFGYGELVEFLGHPPTTWQPAVPPTTEGGK